MADTLVSHAVLSAARRLAERGELAGASMADIATEAGITRVTLYRRGETRAAIVAALRDELVREERELLLPILASEGDARIRLTRALEAVCAITDARADLLAGMDDAALNAIYHDDGAESLTRSEFVAPLVRLLRDGALDGSLRTFADPAEAATVLYTQVTYTYLHLVREHRWSAERATAAVIDLTTGGLRA
ncbi:MAG: transcriptional regulator [Solirubrobacterales bacterium]|jgi:AcrR family transcriptional regulator|nr:transcriptional regulator [Solirubrobacterales bacterium]